MIPRDLNEERKVYLRMWMRHSEAQRLYAERQFGSTLSRPDVFEEEKGR